MLLFFLQIQSEEEILLQPFPEHAPILTRAVSFFVDGEATYACHYCTLNFLYFVSLLNKF